MRRMNKTRTSLQWTMTIISSNCRNPNPGNQCVVFALNFLFGTINQMLYFSIFFPFFLQLYFSIIFSFFNRVECWLLVSALDEPVVYLKVEGRKGLEWKYERICKQPQRVMISVKNWDFIPHDFPRKRNVLNKL